MFEAYGEADRSIFARSIERPVFEAQRTVSNILQAFTLSLIYGSFLALVQHRFASHCCEALFIRSAPIVTDELLEPLGEMEPTPGDEHSLSMENLFLNTINELEENMGYLMTNPFGSHTLRVLLAVLSGRPLADASTTSLLQSKKKEHNEAVKSERKSQELVQDIRTVPSSFDKILGRINSSTIGGLDSNYLRALALQPLANPVLQLLLEIEIQKSGKQKAKDKSSLFRKLITDETLEDGTSNAAFLKGLLYDPVGSHLLESIIQHAPGKTFKSIYRSLFHDDLSNIVRNEIAGFVVMKILERLSSEDLRDALENICPEIPMLVDRSRTSIIKTLIERCKIRNVDTTTIAAALETKYGAPGKDTITQMLKFQTTDTNDMAEDRKAQIEALDTSKVHTSLLVQSMLDFPGPLRDFILSSLLAMEPSSLVRMAKDRSASRVLQASLTCREQTQPFRRKLIQCFKDYVNELATDVIGSHVIDVFWKATYDLHFLRELIAEELAANEAIVKDTYPGRAVWRNWVMDIFKKSRHVWILKSKEKSENNFPERATIAISESHSKAKKSGIEAARERFANKHRGGGNASRSGGSRKSNSNGTILGRDRLASAQTRQQVTA